MAHRTNKRNASRRGTRHASANHKTITVIAAADANIAALIVTHSLVAGAFFTVNDTADTADSALAGFKGSAPAAGDRFYINTLNGATTYRP